MDFDFTMEYNSGLRPSQWNTFEMLHTVPLAAPVEDIRVTLDCDFMMTESSDQPIVRTMTSVFRDTGWRRLGRILQRLPALKRVEVVVVLYLADTTKRPPSTRPMQNILRMVMALPSEYEV